MSKQIKFMEVKMKVLILNLSVELLCIYSSIEEGYTAIGGLVEWSRRIKCKMYADDISAYECSVA